MQSTRDLVFGSATLALAIGYYALAVRIPESQLADGVGPQGLPRIYAYLLAGLSLVLVVRSLRMRRREQEAQRSTSDSQRPEPAAKAQLLRPAGVIAIGVAYVVAVPWLGYVVSLAGLIAATSYYLGGGPPRRLVVVALSGATLFWLLFVVLLGIQHPAGFWPPLF
jgi:ABC-type Fe3+ transport system permease subunit